MALVLGGILGLRLHAFLALVAGALVISFLTPKASLERHVESELISKGPTSDFEIRHAQDALTS
ncbi:MAG: GntP family permease, partial [Verrucomicrobiales bacterium]